MRDRARCKAVREIPSGAIAAMRRSVLVLLGAGLALMLWMAVAYLTDRPSLLIHRPVPAASQPESDGVALLMQRVQKNPQDAEAPCALAQHFNHLGEWERAEMFAVRAVLAAPDQADPLYWLGLVQHSQGRHAEAAASLEKALKLGNDPAIRYSLGILYRDYLNDLPKGAALLQQVHSDPAASADLRQHAAEALQSAPER